MSVTSGLVSWAWDTCSLGLQVSRQAGVTPEILQAEYNKFEQAYTKATAEYGATKWDRLNNFRNKAFAGLQQDVQRQMAQARQQEVAAERQKAQQAEQQRQQARLPPWGLPCSMSHERRRLWATSVFVLGDAPSCIVIKPCFDTSTGLKPSVQLVMLHAATCMQQSRR